MEKKVYIIIVNYNNWEDTVECVNSINCSSYVNKQVVIVDNGSTDDSVENLRKHELDNTTIIETHKNLGFAGGNNVGIEYARSNDAEILCLLNNDAVISKNCITECVKILNQTQYGIIGPVIIDYGANTIQSAGGKISLCRGFVKLYHRGECYTHNQNIIATDFVSGCCMFCRIDMIEEIGLIPEAYFLFYEETEWCLLSKRKGKSNACIESCYVEHKDSGSVKKISGIKEYLLTRNRAAFVRRNGNFAQITMFICYIVAETAFLSVKHSLSFTKRMRATLDGLFKRVSDDYTQIIIKE